MQNLHSFQRMINSVLHFDMVFPFFFLITFNKMLLFCHNKVVVFMLLTFFIFPHCHKLNTWYNFECVSFPCHSVIDFGFVLITKLDFFFFFFNISILLLKLGVFCALAYFSVLCCAICFQVVVDMFSALSVYINGACF